MLGHIITSDPSCVMPNIQIRASSARNQTGIRVILWIRGQITGGVFPSHAFAMFHSVPDPQQEPVSRAHKTNPADGR